MDTHTVDASSSMSLLRVGRDGWVDEAIAEWRDDGYPRATQIALTG